MNSTVHFVLLLFCFTFTHYFHLVLLCYFHLVLFCPIQNSASTYTSLHFYNLMDFHWPGTFLSFLLISLQHPDPLQTWVTGGNRFTTRALASTIVSTIDLTLFLQFCFYNIMDTHSVTLNLCTLIFYLDVCIAMFLGHLTSDIVNFLLHYRDGSCTLTCTLFYF